MNRDGKTDLSTRDFQSEEQFLSSVPQEHGVKSDESTLSLFLSVLCVLMNL